MEIPKEIISVIEKLKKNGFEAYLVGGCVRDFLLENQPKDWDITTNAKPKEIQKIFPNSFYKNKFGTVTIQQATGDPEGQTYGAGRRQETAKEVEITTFRTEAKYSDRRHPDKIKFAETIEEDLSRRDFTVNAFALSEVKGIAVAAETPKLKIIDLFGGQKDLENRIIRAVGKPKQRFSEDALRLLRAVRFAATLNTSSLRVSAKPRTVFRAKQSRGLRADNGIAAPELQARARNDKNVWRIEPKTLEAIKENANLIQFISKERIRDELIKILESKNAYEGILLLQKTGLLKYILPELEKGVGVGQNRHHIYTVFKHSVLALKYAVEYKYNLEVRIAALLHDIAKPEVKQGEGPSSTFYNHDIVGAKTTKKILSRLKFPKNTIEKVEMLVRYHMFFYDPETVTESSVRKLLRKVGKENIEELIQVRICDRKGMGRPKAKPYRLRHLEYVISKVSKDPISVKMLKINGKDAMKILNIKSGPKVGLILNALLSEVLDDPKKNKKEILKKRAEKLGKFSEKELKEKEKNIERKKSEEEMEEKRKFYVH